MLHNPQKAEGKSKEMGFNDFWINNNGKKEHLNNAKHGVRKEQVDKKFHNLFDAYDANGDGTLENEELGGVFKGLTKFAGADKTLDATENKQVASLFANQAGIEDADFMGFVKSISKATEDIVDSKTTPTADGGKEVTTTYKDGTVETISYYPDGEYKFKKLDQKATTTTNYYTIGNNIGKHYTADEIESRVKKAYNQRVAQIKASAEKNKPIEGRAISIRQNYDQFKQEYMQRNRINQGSDTHNFERHDFELSERGKQDVAVRDFVLSHYIDTHKSAKEALESMGILDDVGAAINAGAGELWNSIKNVWNGTDEEYQNFYELSKKFEPNYNKALRTGGSLDVMRNNPEMFFRSFETDFKKDMGHRYNTENSVKFQQTTEQYQNAQILKQRIDILNKAMQEVSMYQVEQDALVRAPAQNEGLNPASHIVSANKLLLQYFNNDQDAVDMILNGTIENADATIKAISGIKADTEKLNSAVLDGKTFDQIQEDYKSQYKVMYGTDFVPDELTDKVMDAKATGGMVKLAAITIVSILVTKSPIFAEISAAAGGAEVTGAAANAIRTLVSKYGQTAVQQGIKLAMTSGTLATDVGLTLINQATSERGVNGEELWESTKGSAKYIFFGAYVGAPLAQAVSKSLGKIGATTRLFEGGVKTGEGAIQTTSITGDKLLQNFMKGGNTALAKGGAFLTEVGAFAGLDVATEDVNVTDALAQQGSFLPKLKVMNHVLEYMLGAKAHTATSRANLGAAIEKSGVKNWNIKEIKTPNKTQYIVDIDGLPVGRFEDANQLATAMLERVTANYNTSARPQTKSQTTKPEGEVKAPKVKPESEVVADIQSETKVKAQSEITKPQGIIETEISERNPLIERLGTANDRESFVAIRDEIKKLPNGEEKTQLMQAYLKKYNEWSADPSRPDIRMQYIPDEDPLNQNTDEVRTMINNTITRLRQTSNGEDVTFKINGKEHVFQAYKGNVANNGGYCVTDGENVYVVTPKASKELCHEEVLADELYCQVMGCLPRDRVVVETDNGFAVMTKSIFNKGGFQKNKEAIVQTYGMDALLGNVDNVALVSKGKNPVLISNNASINLRRARNGFVEGQNATAVYQLASMFEVAKGLSPGSKNAIEMRKASKEELISSLQKVVDLPDEKLLAIINNSQIESKEQLGRILVGRKHFIAKFLENLKNTEQEGLPIEEFVGNVYRQTYAQNSYDMLKGNTNTEFTDYISEKFNFSESELLDYQKILQQPELASHIKEKIEDSTITKEDLIEFNKSQIFLDLGFTREKGNDKNTIFDTVIDLKKNNNMSISEAYSLIRRFAQHKDGEVISQRVLTNIREINQELSGNANSVLYQKLFKDIQTCEIDKTKLDIVKDLKSKGIDDKYLVLLLDTISNPDGTINIEKQNALNGLFEHNTPPEDIPMYFSAVNTPNGVEPNMLLLVDKYKELGLDNDAITNLILSTRFKANGTMQQRTHSLEIPLLFPDEVSNPKLLNDAVKELKLWTPNVEEHIKKAIEKNPNIKLTDLVGMLRSFHKDMIFDQQGYAMAFRLLENGVSPNGMGSFVSASKITPRPVNGLTPEEAATQTTKLRVLGEYLLGNGYTTEQVYKLIEVAKTNSKIDDFVLNIIQNNSHKYSANDLLCLINYSKVMPGKEMPVESVNSQRQQIFDTMVDLIQNKGYSAIDAGKSIVQALSVQRALMRNQVTGLNTNTLDFCKKCTDNDISVNDVQLLAYNSRILDNVSGLTPEEINAKQKTILDWADKLLFEDKLPPKTVAKFMEIAAFKTNRGNAGVRKVTYNFDENVINIINRMVEEKAITSESDANIAQVIGAFKILDYDENAITKAIELLKNPITLKNGKQYEMDSESIGLFIATSKDINSGKFDIDKFNRNVDIYILKAEHGFSIKEMVMLAKLYKGDITVDRLSTGQKVNLLNKLSYASKDAIELIQDKVIDTKDANDNIISGDIELLTQKLLTDINLASKNIRTNQTQRQAFLQNFISNKGRNPKTGLNNIETKIAEFDFTQYGKEGLPLKYSRNEFTQNIREILADLSPEEQASILRYHNIDLGVNGFNSNPRIRRINQSVETLTNEGYKNVIDELSTLLKGVNEDNLQLYKENNIDNITKKCVQLSQLSESQIAEIVRDYPELNIEDITTLQTQAREFAELVENNDVGNLPTPLAVKTTNEEIEGFNQYSDKMKAASAKIETEYNKFIYENEFQTGDVELDNILNGIMRGLPDVMLTVGKQQHKTHAYSVDVHTMEVLKKAMNDPEYKTLSDKDRTILKFSILLHDFGKKFINPETPDTGHEIDSAEIATGILAQFKLPATVKEKILNIIKNHDWFARYNRNEWNANKVAALFRSPDDYKIAKIMSKADLFSINPEFQYNPNVLNIKEDKTIEHASRVFDEKLENLDAAYQKMYAKTNIVMNSKILNPSKIPMDEQYGVRVLNLTNENIPSDMDLGQYGMNGTTKNNLRLTVHMVADDNLLGNLESAKLGMESTINDNNVWSISMIKMDRTRTYMHREYGFATDTPISSIAIASPNNLSSGYEKGVDKFVELLFTDNPQRNFLKQRFIQSAQMQGSRITETDYQELSRMVYNKSFLSQLETQSEIEVNGNVYPTSVIVKAIQESTDALFTGQTHTEFVATNPKIQGLVVRKNSMDEVAPDFIAFAKKYNLPILLVGNK